MNPRIAEHALQAYGVAYRTILPAQKGYRNYSFAVELPDGSWQNLIIYKNELRILKRIETAHTIGEYLHSKGLPVRHAVDARLLKLQSTQATRYAALYNYLPGKTIPWEAYTKNHLKLAGMTMSLMHAKLAAAKLATDSVADEYEAIFERLQTYFADANVARAMRQKLGIKVPPQIIERQMFILKLAQKLPHQQLLHMDFVRGNLLFRPAQQDDSLQLNGLALSGIIDFEKAAIGSPLFDIARTLAFFLVDCKYKTPAQVCSYFLQSGYNKHGPAPFTNIVFRQQHHTIDMLEALTSLFLLYDFYKFLRHNPYESLQHNQHFVRTKDILLARKMIELTKEK